MVGERGRGGVWTRQRARDARTGRPCGSVSSLSGAGGLADALRLRAGAVGVAGGVERVGGRPEQIRQAAGLAGGCVGRVAERADLGRKGGKAGQEVRLAAAGRAWGAHGWEA